MTQDHRNVEARERLHTFDHKGQHVELDALHRRHVQTMAAIERRHRNHMRILWVVVAIPVLVTLATIAKSQGVW